MKIGLLGCTLPLALALAAAACGGEDADPPRGGGTRVDAAPPIDAMVPVDAAPAGSCAGEPTACDLAIGPFTCDAQDGCTAEVACVEDGLFYCGDLSEAACADSGCTLASECEGAGLCFIETNELDCVLEPGCTWTSFCDPGSTPDWSRCPLHSEEGSCNDDGICDWAYLGCSGTPAPCAMLDEVACAEQSGCRWEI